MKYTLVICLGLFLSWSQSFAYELEATEVAKPYEIVPIETDFTLLQVHLGVLNDFPLMYEVSSESSSTISVVLQQESRGNDGPVPLGLMIVRENENGGVSEVARFNPKPEDWVLSKNPELGMSLLSSENISKEVGPGNYRIEVSSPNNQGRYLMWLGEREDSDGYFESLGHSREIQKFFGYSVLKMMTSSLVYYPIGIIFLLFAIHRTWKYRKLISDVN